MTNDYLSNIKNIDKSNIKIIHYLYEKCRRISSNQKKLLKIRQYFNNCTRKQNVKFCTNHQIKFI